VSEKWSYGDSDPEVYGRTCGNRVKSGACSDLISLARPAQTCRCGENFTSPHQ
jgi:hypothetical protein